jgi:HEAT repeat protein
MKVSNLMQQFKLAEKDKKISLARKLAQEAKEGNIKGEEVSQLISALDYPDKNVKLAISEAIGWMAHNNVIRNKIMLKPAINLLDANYSMLRHDGAWILESLANDKIVDLSCIDQLLLNLEHENNHVKAATAYTLGTFAKIGVKEERIHNALSKLEYSEDEVVQEAIQTALSYY